ncbi:sugar-transfer associated ATP-grasp domain-containing protein [Qipengyuania sp.]|uniref:sugar-transfer associated ATP-grasp domain-containing protein n=1 Tax=Qipengyuania sp. TaxID=2004515 RepID=UPI003BAAF813
MINSERILEMAENRQAHRLRERKMPENWWFYAKKKFPLFPGVSRAVHPSFLDGYYQAWQMRMGWPRKLINALSYAIFQAWLPWRARKIADRFGLDKSWRRKALSLSRDRFVDPSQIDVYRIESPDELDSYLRSFEWNEINRRLNPRHWGPDCVLFNKADFYLRCMLNGTPIPKTYAITSSGVPEIFELPEPGKIIVKPSLGCGGVGIAIRNVPPDLALSHNRFETFLMGQTEFDCGDWIYQEKCKVHPALAPIALDALPTARISTMVNEHGEAEIVTSVLRFASVPETVVDNLSAGGSMAPIDLETGEVGTACMGHHGGDFVDHPETGARIAGLTMPAWEVCKSIVQKAHLNAFPDYALIGWDVGITDNGPVIIEGNAKPCPVVAQRGPRKGLGDTRFGELIAWHLAQQDGTESR